MARENIVQIMRRGVPTAPDVDRLMTLDMRPGARVGVGQVETILGRRRAESRFTTVTNAWRKRLLREAGLRVILQGELFVALTASESLSASLAGVNRVRRAASREVIYAGVIDTNQLAPDEQQRHMLLRRHSAALLEHAQDVCRAIAPPKPVRSK